MPRDYCQDIASVITDFRYKDREKGKLNINIDRFHVEKWINQFEDNHEIILQETLNLLENYYFTKEDVTDYLTAIYSSPQIWGDDVQKKIATACFLNCQMKGNSQKRLYKKSKKIIEKLYGIDITTREAPYTSYLYVDDCMFSGKTAKNDIGKLIERIPRNSIVDSVFIVAHSFAEWWVKESLKETLEEKNITLNIWRLKSIQNSGGRNHIYECLWPMEYQSDDLTDYITYIQDEIEQNPGKKYRLFRTNEYTGGVYTSEDNRKILEIELMKAGLKIRGFTQNPNIYMRPMGYDNRISFGFGAFFATYLNISNNCPLAFWWGDPHAPEWHPFSKWYPLLPRRANDPGGDMIAW